MPKLYEKIASCLVARINCEKSGNAEWFARHTDVIETLCKNELPSGSGFDCGTRFNFDESRPDRLVFDTDFHHMDENGYYDGWTSHKVIVTPSLAFLFDVRITGRDRRQIKEYMQSEFCYRLNCDIED